MEANETDPGFGPCHMCGSPGPAKRCTRCWSVVYCGGYCQRLDWARHRPTCVPCKKPGPGVTSMQPCPASFGPTTLIHPSSAKLWSAVEPLWVPSLVGQTLSNIVVTFCGVGDGGESFVRLAQGLRLPQTAFLVLRAPWPLIEGVSQAETGADAGCWFPAFESDGSLLRGTGDGRRVHHLNHITMPELIPLIGRLTLAGAKVPLHGPRIHLMGYGDGAIVATELALRLSSVPPPDAFSHRDMLGCVVALGDACLEEDLVWRKAKMEDAPCSTDRQCGHVTLPVLVMVWDGTPVADEQSSATRLMQQKVDVLQYRGFTAVQLVRVREGSAVLQHASHLDAVVSFWAQHFVQTSRLERSATPVVSMESV